MISPELQTKLNNWRQRAADGTITLEEMREGVRELRSGRLAAMAANSSSGKKSKAPPRSVDDMLGELGSI